MLIVQNPQGELIGIPLDSAPSLRRVPRSAFAPLPPTYLTEGGVRCVSALIVLNPKEAPLFLLNLDQLLQSRSTLPITEPHQSLTGN
ncbi:MAG: hypothetical protein HC769_24185 [Cyanobacteria bacterium CRU_2_1]|nr:hypothetical protein [Cyanobacteria bacterium CRU_2_1]